MTRSNVILVFVLVAVLSVSFRFTYTQIIGRLIAHDPFDIMEPVGFIIRETLYHLPFFCLGVALYSSKQLAEMFHHPQWSMMVLSLFLVGACELLYANSPGLVTKLFLIVSHAFVAISLSNILFFLADRFLSKGGETLRFLSDASYTVYIFHYFFIYLFALMLSSATSSQYVLVAASAVMTLSATLAVHYFVVKEFRLAGFFVNGKL